MTDRELLEAAARAAGLTVWQGQWPQDEMLFCATTDTSGVVTGVEWNPLTDDGDALRLAVKLKLKITIGNGITMVENPRIPDVGVEFYEGAEVATRRAIVRAAAALSVSQGTGSKEGRNG